jgi:hypothetical protein
MMKPENFLWVEKYRPATIDECVLPMSLKSTFSDMVAKGEPQNLLFSGTAGVGKQSALLPPRSHSWPPADDEGYAADQTPPRRLRLRC